MSFSIFFSISQIWEWEGEEPLWTCLQSLLGSCTASPLLSPHEYPLLGPVFPARARHFLIQGFWLVPPTQQRPWRMADPVSPYASARICSDVRSFSPTHPSGHFSSRSIQDIGTFLKFFFLGSRCDEQDWESLFNFDYCWWIFGLLKSGIFVHFIKSWGERGCYLIQLPLPQTFRTTFKQALLVIPSRWFTHHT